EEAETVANRAAVRKLKHLHTGLTIQVPGSSPLTALACYCVRSQGTHNHVCEDCSCHLYLTLVLHRFLTARLQQPDYVIAPMTEFLIHHLSPCHDPSSQW